MKVLPRQMSQILNWTDVNGTGTVLLKNRTFRDVEVVGVFQVYRWWFMLHRDVEYPDYYTVSEASTGCLLMDLCYENEIAAMDAALNVIHAKRYYFATSVLDLLVKLRYNLLKRNLSVRTIALDIIL